MIDQNVDVTVLNFITPFCTCSRKGCKHEASQVSKLFKTPIKIITAEEEYIEIIRNPKHGYGKNMNPCIDCRIFMFKKAKEYMNKINANFIFTGEVLNQRPMSQHKKALKLIEKESGLENLVVRPLSAKLLEPTILEKKNWIKKEKLLSIKGRRRIPQKELADKFGIKDYPCPAGGCQLTDLGFAKRLKEAFKHNEYTIKDIHLLRYGRHFRLENGTKIIVGRNKKENNVLQRFFDKNDVLIETINTGSPIVLLKKSKNKKDIMKAASLCARYSDIKKDEKAKIKIKYYNKQETFINITLKNLELTNIKPITS